MFISKSFLFGVLWRGGGNVVILPYSAQQKHAFLGEIKQMSKSNKLAPRMNIYLKLLHYIFGHRSTRSLMAEDTSNDWKDIELIIDPDSF